MSTPVVLMLILAGATTMASLAMPGALWLDKRRATRGQWRISERTLHTIELCGGWLGSLLARRTLRHKSRKPSYRLVSDAITTLHLSLWAALTLWALRT